MEKVRIYVEQITEGQVLLTDAQLAQFEQYYDMLIEKNKVMNLTAITEREEVILKHFIDSLALAGYVKMWEKPYKIIDVGTGAGFPGIPLKIAFPNLQVTLFDSLNKRIKFLQDVIEALNLNEISAVHGRAEEGARDKAMREKYDFVVSRAVANMAVLSEYCIGYQSELCIYQKRKTDTKSISAKSRNCKQTTPRLISQGVVLIMTLCLTSYPEFVLSLFHGFQTFFIGWNHRFNDKYIVVS